MGKNKHLCHKSDWWSTEDNQDAFDYTTRSVDPWIVSHHDVPLKVGELDFLYTKVDDPIWWYQSLWDFIDGFKFPQMTISTLITLLQKIVVQCITSRCIQLIKDSDAVLLDQQITGKVHQCFKYPYCLNMNVLTLLISHLRMEFLSIARINVAVEGLAWDLNHHIPAYRTMVRLTLADWMCDINRCINPLDSWGLTKDFTQYYRKIPASWIFTQKGMLKLNPKLSLYLTDSSHIIQGYVFIMHTLNLCWVHGNEVPNGHAFRSIMSKGLMKLSDIELWHKNWMSENFITYSEPALWERWTTTGKDNWKKVAIVMGIMFVLE